jgi:hypothetical protein
MGTKKIHQKVGWEYKAAMMTDIRVIALMRISCPSMLYSSDHMFAPPLSIRPPIIHGLKGKSGMLMDEKDDAGVPI